MSGMVQVKLKFTVTRNQNLCDLCGFWMNNIYARLQVTFLHCMIIYNSNSTKATGILINSEDRSVPFPKGLEGIWIT